MRSIYDQAVFPRLVLHSPHSYGKPSNAVKRSRRKFHYPFCVSWRRVYQVPHLGKCLSLSFLTVMAAFTPSLSTEVLYLSYGYDRRRDGVFQGTVEKGAKIPLI